MDEGRRLEGLVRLLRGHARGGEFAHLVVDEREQLGRCFGVTRRGRVQKLADVRHATEFTPGDNRHNQKIADSSFRSPQPKRHR